MIKKHKSVVYLHDFEFKQYGRQTFGHLCTSLLKLGSEGRLTLYSDSLLQNSVTAKTTLKNVWKILPNGISIRRLPPKPSANNSRNFAIGLLETNARDYTQTNTYYLSFGQVSRQMWLDQDYYLLLNLYENDREIDTTDMRAVFANADTAANNCVKWQRHITDQIFQLAVSGKIKTYKSDSDSIALPKIRQSKGGAAFYSFQKHKTTFNADSIKGYIWISHSITDGPKNSSFASFGFTFIHDPDLPYRPRDIIFFVRSKELLDYLQKQMASTNPETRQKAKSLFRDYDILSYFMVYQSDQFKDVPALNADY